MKPKSSSAVRIWMVLLTAACSSDRNLPQKMCHPCDEIYVCSQTMKMSGQFAKYYIQPFFGLKQLKHPELFSADLPLTLANRGAALVIVSVHCGTLLLDRKRFSSIHNLRQLSNFGLAHNFQNNQNT